MVERSCLDCGGPISPKSSGRCRPCGMTMVNRSPEKRARMAALMRHRRSSEFDMGIPNGEAQDNDRRSSAGTSSDELHNKTIEMFKRTAERERISLGRAALNALYGADRAAVMLGGSHASL